MEPIEEASDAQREWAAGRLAKWAADLAAAPSGKRNETFNNAAIWAGGAGAHGFLTEDEARAALAAAWEELGKAASEFRSTFKSGWQAGLRKPIRDFPQEIGGDVFDDLGERDRYDLSVLLGDDPPKPKSGDLSDLLGDDPPKPAAQPKLRRRILEPSNPMPAARAMVEDCHTTDSVRTMHRYRGTFWKWYGSCYRERNPESVSAHVWKYLERSRKEATNRKGVTFITDFAPTNTNGR